MRPNLQNVRFLPKRWRPLGWMDPRTYYSTRRRKALAERIESSIRWRVKNLLMRSKGSYQLMDAKGYAKELEHLHRAVSQSGCKYFVILGPTPMDPKFFPGSNEQLMRHALFASRIPDTTFIDAWEVLNLWNDYFSDHLHPNSAGHDRIATLCKPVLERVTARVLMELD